MLLSLSLEECRAPSEYVLSLDTLVMLVNILFLCGTLEPAKSGVADFIHALAGKLSSNGISCACLAIHDPYIQATESHLVHRST